MKKGADASKVLSQAEIDELVKEIVGTEIIEKDFGEYDETLTFCDFPLDSDEDDNCK